MTGRVETLLGGLSWEQKLGQLQIIWRQDADEVEALVRNGLGATFWPMSAARVDELQAIAREATGIPLLIALDVVHGQFTIFPTPLAQAASFDEAVATADGRVSAREARSVGVTWTFSPMVDVTRDPRWGRVVEGFGEDPYLASRLAVASTRAYQGDDLRASGSVAACLKHFVAYGAAEAGRDYNTTDMSARRLRDVYLAPFRAAVDAGAASVMASFTSLNGRPMHAHRELLTGVLKEEWGFDGVVVGDADGVAQLVPHGIAVDEKDAVRQAIEAGVDIVMGGSPLVDAAGRALLAPDEIDPSRVDDAVRRVLRLKERLGLLDSSGTDPSPAITAPTASARRAAERAAERCLVLLRNEDRALPLASGGRALLVGPYVDSLDHLGAWVQGFAAPTEQSLEDALRQELPGIAWDAVTGFDFFAADEERIAEAVARSALADVVVVAVGEPSRLSGEAASLADIALPPAQTRLIHALADAGNRVVVVLATGRPLVVEDWIERVDAVLCAWHLGIGAGRAIAGALSGRIDPGGRVPMTFPRAVGQIPVHHDHERTGRPPRTGGELVGADAAPVGDSILGPGNLDDHYSSKYLDLPLGPRFPFGHGLSYTTFALDALEVDGEGDAWTVSATVRNTGDREGDDVVLMLVTDEVASLTQPVQRLRGFRRVTLAAGEETRVSFALAAAELGFWTDDERFVVEPGSFRVAVSDGHTRVETSIGIEEAP